MNNISMKKFLLAFIFSLTLCDHMGDAADVIETALEKIGVQIEWSDLDDLGQKLQDMGVQLATFYDLPILEDEENE